MNDLQTVTFVVAVIVAIAVGFGTFTKYNIDKKNKPNKKLSKKQKRELNKV